METAGSDRFAETSQAYVRGAPLDTLQPATHLGPDDANVLLLKWFECESMAGGMKRLDGDVVPQSISRVRKRIVSFGKL
jgi:hypothetical protein